MKSQTMVLILLLLVLPKAIMASPIEVIKNYIFSSNETSSAVKKSKSKKTSLVKKDDKPSEFEEIKQLDRASTKELKNYLNKNSIGVWDFTTKYDVKTGTAIRGILLNSVVSSNLESPILVETTEAFSGIPEGTKFSCTGATKNKRVLAVCNKLVTESDEYEVDTILLNNDGTAGLLGKAYSGKEQYAVGAITAAALKGALDVSLDRVNTSFGTESVTTTAKNKIKSGGIGALDEIVQMNADEYKTQEPKISIDSGMQVLIYFNRRFKL
jgi:hypothetical protein